MASKADNLQPKGATLGLHSASPFLQRTTTLPPFEPDLKSRKLCIFGLLVSLMLSIASIGLSIPVFVHEHSLQNKSSPIIESNTAKELVGIILNVCVTICTEVLGFIHATSLRWALYHEGRLNFNSNLRLFTNARNCAANSWYTNCVWALLITISYSSASQVIQPTSEGQSYALNSQALAFLGMAIFLQAMLALWCLVPSNSRQILSWNASPLNTALALLHEDGIHPTSQTPTAPRSRQTNARSASKAVRIIVFFLWTILPFITAWGVIMWFISIKMNGKPNTTFDPENTSGGVYPSSASNVDLSRYDTLFGLAVITAMQLIYTLALHTMEQIVNLSRDESVWRRAGDLSEGSVGATISLSSFKAAISSWQTLALLILKPMSHWLFGLSAVTFSFGYLAFNPIPIFCLAGMSLLLAILATYLSYRRPKGPQPVAFGNLKKLGQYIDDWGEGAGGRLYWGEKFSESDDQVRLAGTSPRRTDVSEIRMDGVSYIGLH